MGIETDVMLGYAQHEGFRAGICLPFQPYNLDEGRPYNVIEIPLTIMDGTLSEEYRNLSVEEAWQSILSLLETTKRFGGCIVLLWHNTRLNRLYDHAILYEKALKWIAENSGVAKFTKDCRIKYEGT